MLSHQRYQGEADMALTGRDTAQSEELYVLYDQAWAALTTAARHTLLAARWSQAAAADRQAAAQAPTLLPFGTPKFLRGTDHDRTLDRAQLEQRAIDSERIAQNHRVAADRWGEDGITKSMEAGKKAKQQAIPVLDRPEGRQDTRPPDYRPEPENRPEARHGIQEERHE